MSSCGASLSLFGASSVNTEKSTLPRQDAQQEEMESAGENSLKINSGDQPGDLGWLPLVVVVVFVVGFLCVWSIDNGVDVAAVAVVAAVVGCTGRDCSLPVVQAMSTATVPRLSSAIASMRLPM